ncbi:extracellular solute-binding protein [Roseospira goensis]|uniref:Multiple sugar transport system substrate-binding protein n=1 Tax=Roseospira goensis TaxID=391922 RepID=A0A7W6WJH2_9PROT|nr:extracellular solute-binding protein [Roseospira goensis]MBB4284492.1 multiple sugar transport system substrate-binding protein [Roseospira goensis]
MTVIGRRRLLGLAAGAAVLGGAPRWAQGQPSGTAPLSALGTDPPEPGIKLRFWTTERGADRVTVIRYLLDVQAAFAGQPPVVIETVAEEDVVARLRAAHDPASRIPIPHLVNTGADTLLALDTLGLLSRDGHRVVQTLGDATFETGALAALRRPDGRLAAIPFHGWPQIVWARRDWLADSLGQPVPQTVDALRRAAHRLHDPAAGRRGIILGTTGDFYTQQCFMMIARAYGAGTVGPDGAPQLDTPAMVAALEAYADLARAAGPGALTWRARDYYLQGRAAFLVYSTFLMDDLAVPAVAQDSLTGAHFPDLDGAPFDPLLVEKTAPIATLGGAAPGAIGAFSSINGLGLTGVGDPAERLAARSLALFLFRRDAYIAWLHMAPGGMIPLVRGILETDAFMRDRLGVFRAFGRDVTRRFGAALRVPSTASTVVAEAAGRPYADPRAGLLYAERVLGRMVARVLAGETAPRAAARAAQAEARALLE